MRVFIALSVLIGGTSPSHAQTLSANEYWDQVFVLFQEFLLMETDGVFLDDATLQSLGPLVGEIVPNNIRGDNPPVMFFARPPGSEWLKRMQALNEVDVEGGISAQCRTIPTTALENTIVCGYELSNLYTGITGDIDVDFLDATMGKLWLARICYETPSACAAYTSD